MSPISPLVVSYQASGRLTVVPIPTSMSVTASTSSCELTDVTLLNMVDVPQPLSQPEPGDMSGMTPYGTLAPLMVIVPW
jgi:hypothetical protein